MPNPHGVPKRLSVVQHTHVESVQVSEFDFNSPAIIASPDIFIFAIIGWGFRYQRPQHIAKNLAQQGRRVFYIEMEQTPDGTTVEKLDDNLFRVRLNIDNTNYIQHYTGQPTGDQLQKWMQEFLNFCTSVKSTSFKQVIVQHPYWWQLVKHLSPEYEVTFDCMDDMSGFENTEPFLLELEHEMLVKADRLVVSSQHLFDKYKHLSPPALVRNAGQIEHFKIERSEVCKPEFLSDLSDEKSEEIIRVGYVGAIADWFYSDLLDELAKNAPNIELHLCGEVTASHAAELEKNASVYMYGEIPYVEAPHFIQHMDVMIIPFKLVPIIQACDPVKFYEYCAAGKPTVATSMPELNRVGEYVFFADTAKDFEKQIVAAAEKANDKEYIDEIQSFAADNTWVQRSEKFLTHISEHSRVSVVILAYGDPELTNATLHSLFVDGPVYPNMEIIIVDNGSTDESIHSMRDFAASYPDVKFIENGENLGFARGNNVGLVAATGEYVLLLNNDTVVSPGAISAMVSHLKKNPSIGVVGPLTNNIGNEAKVFIDYENMAEMRTASRLLTSGYRGKFTKIDVAAYFAVMFRREDLSEFGLLAEEYGRGMFEDDDHCAQIKEKGYICALAEDAFVHHHLSASFSKLKEEERTRLFEENKKVYEQKWGEWRPHRYRDKRPISSLGTSLL